MAFGRLLPYRHQYVSGLLVVATVSRTAGYFFGDGKRCFGAGGAAGKIGCGCQYFADARLHANQYTDH